MGFSKVYKSLQDIFPEIDNRVLRAVALENRKDADAAAEVVLTKVIPHFIARSTYSCSFSHDKDAVQSHEEGDELENSAKIRDKLHATPEALKPCLDTACKTESFVSSIIEDESILTSGSDRSSSQIFCTIAIEDGIAVERKKKNNLFEKMQYVVSLMKTLEVEEAAAEKVKTEAANGELEILKRLEEINEKLQRTKEANDMHSGEVYGQKAILATEVKELQSRVLSLSEQRHTSLRVLDEMCQHFEEKIDTAKKEKKEAEKIILEKKICLAEKDLIREKVVQEANVLKQLEEQNSKLRGFLLDRGRVVDVLQGELSLINENVKLVKEKFDELLLQSRRSLPYAAEQRHNDNKDMDDEWEICDI